MKLFSGAVTLLFLLVFGISSCNSPCKDVKCGSHGECEEGICVCEAGYEGLTCESKVVSKFIGNFNCSESCNSGSGTYVVEISEDLSQVSKVKIDNLYNSTVVIEASVVDSTLEIPSQSFGNGEINGQGSIDASGVINATFSVVNGPITDNCTVVLERN